jgi:hypothetical protein
MKKRHALRKKIPISIRDIPIGMPMAGRAEVIILLNRPSETATAHYVGWQEGHYRNCSKTSYRACMDCLRSAPPWTVVLLPVYFPQYRSVGVLVLSEARAYELAYFAKAHQALDNASPIRVEKSQRKTLECELFSGSYPIVTDFEIRQALQTYENKLAAVGRMRNLFARCSDDG